MRLSSDIHPAAPLANPILGEESATPQERYADYKIIRRNGAVVAFEPDKISVAMTKAFLAVSGNTAAASAGVREKVRALTDSVVNALLRRHPAVADVREVALTGLGSKGRRCRTRAAECHAGDEEGRNAERAHGAKCIAPCALCLQAPDYCLVGTAAARVKRSFCDVPFSISWSAFWSGKSKRRSRRFAVESPATRRATPCSSRRLT